MGLDCSFRVRRMLAGAFGIALMMAASPAFAQVDISGEWASRVHEDQPHRAPGAELGDYGGLPINAAASGRANGSRGICR